MSMTVTSQAEPIPGYRLLERLGQGGFGEVWKVEAPGGLHKAIKSVHGALDGNSDDEVRVRQELKALERVKTVRHPFILSIERFDIVGWDPRGTGLSEPAIDCIDDYDRYFASTDITPDDDTERQEIIGLAEEFADQCVANNEDYFAFVGTNNSARDMNAIREALGEEQISYFGFSYGSELGATWATLFPETVRAAVLDGAADPNADGLEASLQQAAGFEGTLTTYLAQCSDDPQCAFHNGGDAEGAFDELMESLDEQPIPSVPGRPDVTFS